MGRASRIDGPSPRVMTRGEVARHDTTGDRWVVVDGIVLDVTSFQAQHPGGDGVFARAGGADVSGEFSRADHSPTARAMFSRMQVGVIEGYEKGKEKGCCRCVVS